MTFETEHDAPIDDPSPGEIALALRRLGDGFAVLARSKNDFVQATAGEDGGYLLERQDGAIERHFQSRDRSMPLATVIGAFQAYARGEATWAEQFDWEPLAW